MSIDFIYKWLKSGVFTVMSIDITKVVFTGNGSDVLCYILPGYRVLTNLSVSFSLNSIYTQIFPNFRQNTSIFTKITRVIELDYEFNGNIFTKIYKTKFSHKIFWYKLV